LYSIFRETKESDMKKKLTGIAALAAVGIALAGCAAGGVPAGGSAVALDPDAKLDGEITVWSWDVGAVALERLAADFEKAHKGTTVNVVDVGYDNA
jgi:lactose/L-arabinose transport system substrate-binding protein